MPPDELSRRSVLRGAAGVGAAGIAASTLAGIAAPALAAPATSAAPEQTGPLGPKEPDHIVVHLRDARSGTLHLYQGTSEAELHDADLAARIVRASRQVR